MLPISDATMRVIEYALDGLTTRSETIANNVANAEVPGFRSSKVDFEDKLRRALQTGNFSGLRTPSTSDAGDAPKADGNTVAIQDEVVDMIKTNLATDAMVNAFNFKVGVMRSAIRGQ
jgi:flagellar basal-body rod protein FlgB